jgi:hypothetical protein
VALCDLLQLQTERINQDRLYRSLGDLLVHKSAIESH